MARLRRFNADCLDLAWALNGALAALIISFGGAALLFLALGRWG